MLEIFKSVTPYVTLVIGFFLSMFTGIFQGWRQDRRKIRRLLFHLLEFRFQFQQETRMKQGLITLRPKILELLSREIGVPFEMSEEDFGKLFLPMIFNAETEERMEQLALKVDAVLQELSEVEPLLAFELTGKYSIRDRLSYLGHMPRIGELPFDMEEWLKPLVKDDISPELDHTILQISSRISRKIHRETKDHLQRVPELDDTKLEELVRGYVKKLRESLEETVEIELDADLAGSIGIDPELNDDTIA
ncbi:hypothetical protein ACTJKC_02795 [Pedobacter sp. 22226]|uniref:hypothetical protein n=1 Tax=Pedobacter sp. 22226 TaxID=3453894 RepID=UPI003F853700